VSSLPFIFPITSVVNFTNILRAAFVDANALALNFHFTAEEPKAAQFHQHVNSKLLHAKNSELQKRQSGDQCLFVLLGSEHVKAAHKI